MLVLGIMYQEPGVTSDHAYAPWPMVFEIIRKGSSLGSGANCECAIILGVAS